MLIRILAKHSTQPWLDYSLVDILRALARQNWPSVIGRQWRVSDLDLCVYKRGLGGWADTALRLMFPEADVPEDAEVCFVTGERLLERSAVVHQFEDGLFLRLVDPEVEPVANVGYRLWHGPPGFQFSNVDLEIRCEEACAYEVVSNDLMALQHLANVFGLTEFECAPGESPVGGSVGSDGGTESSS